MSEVLGGILIIDDGFINIKLNNIPCKVVSLHFFSQIRYLNTSINIFILTFASQPGSNVLV